MRSQQSADSASALGCVEQLDDRVRRARELCQRGNDWLAKERTSFRDRYVGHELNIGVRRSLPEETDYGFLICAQPTCDRVSGLEINNGSPPIESEGQRYDFGVYQPTVLPHDVELVERPERFVPSLIRFQRFDVRTFDLGERLYEFVAPVISSHERGGASGDRKVRVFVAHCAAARGERRGENIQAASDRVDISADLDVELARQRAFHERYHGIVSGWRWRIFDREIHVVCEPGIDPFLEGWELGYGPIDAGLGV